jgi:polygalacturonase
VLIEDSQFSTGDDCIVIKSGVNEDGWRVGRPSENIVVRRVRGAKGHGGIVIGSEMSGGVKNVYATDCDFVGTDRGLRIKSMRGRGGVVENVWYEKIRHQNLRLMVVELTTFYNSSTLVPLTQKPPTIRGVHVRDITARGAKKAVDIVGLPELPIQDVSFENLEVTSREGVRCTDAQGIRFDHVKVTADSGTPFKIENSRQVVLNASCPTGGADCIKLAGDRNAGITVDGALSLK